MAKKTSLEQWIREVRCDIDKETIRVIQLVHKVGTTDTEVYSKRIVPAATDKDLAEMFYAKAETYAQDLTGMQLFGLLVYYGENKDSEGRIPFTIKGKLDFSEEGNATEGPDEKGIRQQVMRHTEMLAQGYFKGLSTLFNQQQAMIVELGVQNKILSNENREALGIVKEVMLTEATRRAENKMAMLKFERETAERQKWLKILPAVANNVLGREIFPRDLEDTALVEAVIEKLGDDDMKKLSMVLPSEILAPFASRAQKYWKEQRAITEEAKRLAEENLDASVDEARKELQ